VRQLRTSVSAAAKAAARRGSCAPMSALMLAGASAEIGGG
jgi:hypothetical protein